MLLAGVTLTMVVMVAFWGNYPIVALLCLMAVYIVGAVVCYARLTRLQRAWETLPSTIEQLRKDIACLAKGP
ncbi:MAG: phage holin family protein [Verrucomicrobiota bacterium]|nr:phage holin family protein [Verrucomicrobiota bacterium]